MREKDQIRPVPPKESDMLTNAASSGDCTGLIPAGKVTEEELADYQEVYQFGAPKMEDSEK